MQETKEIRWHAMAVNLKKCSITGIPFVVDPYTDAEEPELLENGDVPMVEFHFCKEDFEIIKALSEKMAAKDENHLSIEQWEIEALGNRMLSGMLKEFMDFIDKGGNEYRLTDKFKEKARELIKRETDPSKISIRSRDVRCPYCERMTTFIEGCTKGICQFCGQSMEIK